MYYLCLLLTFCDL